VDDRVRGIRGGKLGARLLGAEHRSLPGFGRLSLAVCLGTIFSCAVYRGVRKACPTYGKRCALRPAVIRGAPRQTPKRLTPDLRGAIRGEARLHKSGTAALEISANDAGDRSGSRGLP
jgi:hypothetical protein